MLQVHQFPCLSDNYGFLVHEPQTGATACVDTPDAAAILAAAEAKGWRITDIWNTHWHPDHAGGNAEIIAKTGAKVTGPSEVTKVAPAPDAIVGEGDTAMLGNAEARVLDVGGHTLGHIAYVFDDDRIAFVGDTLFAMGCGRMFEGKPEQFWTSLSKLAALPEDFTIYCAHEYTQANARFALHVDPDNAELKARVDRINAMRAENKPTVPMQLAEELKTNPFLRAPLLVKAATDAEAFAAMRAAKDKF